MNLIERSIAKAANLEWVKPGECVSVRPSFVFLYEEASVKVFSHSTEVVEGMLVVGSDTQIFEWGGVGAIPFLLPASLLAKYSIQGSEVLVTVPDSIYIDISGPLNDRFTIFDLISYLQNYFQTDGLMGMGAIIGGNATQQIGLHERMMVSRLIAELGAIAGVISPDGQSGQVEKVIKIRVEEI